MKEIFKNKKLVTILVVSAVLIIGGAWLGFTLLKDEEKDTIETVKVEKDSLEVTVSVSGEIEAQEEAQVRFKISGRLVWVGVAKGDRVKKWQALASIDRSELEKELARKLNDFMTQRWDFDQAHDDYQEEKDNAVITKEIERILDKAQFALDNQIIDVELADLALKYATIYSPIDGLVTEIDSPFSGVNITPAQATFTIVNPDSLVFSLKVNETEVVGLKKDQEVNIRLDAFPDRVFTGKVDQIGFTPLPDQGTYYQVIVSFLEKETGFRVGMSGDGKIVIEKKDQVLVVPETALVKRGDDYSVFKVVEGRARKQLVTIGLAADSEVEIIEGLEEDDIIISSGVSKISDGEKI